MKIKMTSISVEDPKATHTYYTEVLGSKDVHKEYAMLLEKGVSFKQEPTKTDWGTFAVFDDSCGNYIQIHQD